METTKIEGFQLSPQQERLWLLQKGEGGPLPYRAQCAVSIEGEVKVELLKAAALRAVERHEVLRTTLQSLPGLAVPLQVIGDPLLGWEEHDLSGLDAQQQAARLEAFLNDPQRPGFDLQNGPVAHLSLFSLGRCRHVLEVTLPAHCADGATLSNLVGEIELGYAQEAAEGTAAGPALQYADIAQWLHDLLEEEEAKAGIEYWSRIDLCAVQDQRLSFKIEPPSEAGFRPRWRPVPIDSGSARSLKKMADQAFSTLEALLLSCWQILLWRLTGHPDLVVAAACHGREDEELSGALGLLTRYLPVRCRLSEALRFDDLIKRTEQTLQDNREWQDCFRWETPDEPNGAQGKPSYFPFAYDLETRRRPDGGGGLQFSIIRHHAWVDRFEVKLSCIRHADGCLLELHYDASVLDREDVQRMAAQLSALVKDALKRPQAPVGDLETVGEAERLWLLCQLNAAQSDDWQGRSVQELFERQVDQKPDAIALAFQDQSLSYADLEARAQRLAARLRQMGVGPEVLVGLHLERMPETVTGLLATLKAGGAYLPLDIYLPKARLAAILEDSGAPVVLTRTGLSQGLPEGKAQAVCMDAQWGACLPGAGQAGHRLSPPGGQSLAYVIYTSGSTGAPRGVMIPHSGVVNYLTWSNAAYAMEQGRGSPVHSPLGFDLTVTSLLGPLSAGRCAVLVPEEEGLEGLRDTLAADSGFSLLKITPAHLEALSQLLPAAQAAGRVGALVVGGEALVGESLRFWRAHAPATRVFNEYGPTEAVVGCCVYELREPSPGPGPVPIGSPIANAQIHLLTPWLRLAPVSAPAELCIGGAGLARGYLGCPQATAEKFIPDPFSRRPGERLYKSGDLARRRPDGKIEFLGRLDDQVKIRGFRVELGEVEAVLCRHPGVQECAVVALQDASAPGQQRLVGYWTCSPGEESSAESLLSWLRKELPEYMVPATLALLDRLPLTQRGKVDRAALPDPSAMASQAAFVPPSTQTEELLAGIWSELMQIRKIGAQDDFFALGGHSLLATQLVSRVRTLFEVELSLRSPFQAPTLRQMAQLIDAARRSSRSMQSAPLIPVSREQDLPLSLAQRRLWFIDQFDPGSAAYNISNAVRLSGNLHWAALQSALQEIVRRHEALRTNFGVSKGEPVQLVRPHSRQPLPCVDLRRLPSGSRQQEAQRLGTQEARRGFDLQQGRLMRAAVLQLGSQENIAVLTLHHIVSDGWSQEILIRELAALYEAFSAGNPSPLPELPVQYADYACWQRQWLRGEALERQLKYWRQRLVPLAALDLPADRPRPSVQSFRGSTYGWMMPASLAERLRGLGHRTGATLFMTLLAGLQALFCRYTGQQDIRIGTPSANRNRVEIEGMIGLFVNMLVLRADLSGDPSIEELMAQAREAVLEASLNSDLPFEQLVEALQPERDMSRSPLFQVAFVLENLPIQTTEMPGLRVMPLPLEHGTSKFDLTLYAADTGRGLRGSFEYNRDLFDAATIARMTLHLQNILEGLASGSQLRLSELPLLREAERHQILAGWNDTCTELPEETIQELFDARAEQNPHGLAVVFGLHQMSYAEVSRQASRLGNKLRSLGLGPGQFVAVYLERSAEMIPALVGILKAGAAYVPLESSFPSARIQWILSSLGLRTLLTQASKIAEIDGLAEGCPALEHLICLDSGQAAAGSSSLKITWPSDLKALPAQGPPCAHAADEPAYIIFTSGSTGTPKGVQVTHRPVSNLIRWVNGTFGVGPSDRVLFITSLTFDLSVYDIFGLLAAGGSIEVASELDVKDPKRLAESLCSGAITYWDSAPAALQQVVPFLPPAPSGQQRRNVRLAFLSGDWIPLSLPGQFRASFPDAQVIGLGGATEATVWSNFYPIEEVGRWWASIPYGRPIRNARYHVLDPSLQPVPAGVAGDLLIGGDCLASIYAGEAALTASKFVPDPFAEKPGARLYRSGDRARYWPDGNIEFLGRLDHQVKIRGFRIELGEVETVLRQHEAVGEAVAMVREDAEGDRRLVAYVIRTGSQQGSDGADLRSFLLERLPVYMVPGAFVWLESFPVTPNGKLDRKALPAPKKGSSSRLEASAAPMTQTEEIVAETWSQILGRKGIGIGDDFFELGGHSLLATQAASRLRELFQVDLPLSSLFSATTVAELADVLDELIKGGERIEAPPIRPAPAQERFPLSFSQQRLWLLDQLEPGTSSYNMPSALRVTGPLNLRAVEASLSEVVRRHEALRSRFEMGETEPVQIISEAKAVPLPCVDLGALPAQQRQQQADRLTQREALEPFDLRRGPLLRAAVLRMSLEEHLVLFTTHHIVSDGWSIGVLIREINALYEAAARGLPSPLAELPIQYRDFAAWQRQWLQGEVLEKELAYWRKALQGAPPKIDLPTDRPRSEAMTFRGAEQRFVFPAALARKLEELSRQHGTTLFMTLLAGLQALLSRLTGQDDIVVGCPVANRNRLETEGLIGFFLNTLVVRTSGIRDGGFAELLGQVRERALGAFGHQDLPFEKLVEELKPERDRSRNPIFQVLFTFQNAPQQGLQLPGLQTQMRQPLANRTNFDLALTFDPIPYGLAASALYSTELFDPTTIRRFVKHLEALFEGVSRDPGEKVAELPFLTAAERHQLAVEWDAVSTQWDESAAHQLFERQARALPDAAALTFQGEALSYGELNALSNRLARGLRTLGLEQGQKAATLLGDGPLQAIALFGVLKSGCAFVCLDPDYPSGRQRPILEELAPQFVLTQERCLAGHGALLQGLAAGGGRVAVLDLPDGGGVKWAVGRDALQGCSGADLDLSVPLGDPAYVAYTSGSTGRPKGIIQSQRGLSQFLQWQSRRFGIGPGSRLANWASIGYDASYCEIFGALCFGAKLCLAEKAVRFDPPSLLAWLIEERITLLQTVPSFGRQLLQALGPGADPLPEMEALLLAGEALPAELARRWTGRFPARPRLFNLYGPTESVLATCCPVDAEAAARPSVPVGRAIEGRQILLLDGGGQPCPIGVAGEVFIRSPYLTLGYFERPEETRRSFVANPLPDGRPEPAYRTGDLGKWLPDGRLAFLGRRDNQVKIRGMRVELEDIESALLQEAAVGECAVAVQDYGQGDQRLVAFLVPEAHALPSRKGSLTTRLETEHIESVKAVYDEVYGMQAAYSSADPGLNLRAWTSSYTGEAMPEAEAIECMDSIAARLLSLNPVRALEIGCGSGLLLSRIAPRCESYWGIDPSQQALSFLERDLAQRGADFSQVTLLRGAAHDLGQIENEAFDTVLSNLVVTHYPSAEYLVQAMQSMVDKAAPGGCVLIGSVRSLPLLGAFHTSVQLHRAFPIMTCRQLRRRIRESRSAEKDLVVDPAFFADLQRHIARVKAVELLPKGGGKDNEITRFQYDVLLRLDTDAEPVEIPWQDWRQGGWTLPRLRQLLAEGKLQALALTQVPNARLSEAAAAAELLADPDGPATVEELRQALQSERHQGVHPEDLRRLAEQLPYAVEIRLSVLESALDVVFKRRGTPLEGSVIAFPSSRPKDKPLDWRQYTNDPLSVERNSRIVRQVRGSLRRRLPRHMVPSSLLVVGSLPRTRTGKLDRQALRELSRPRPRLDEESAAPRIAEILGRYEAVKECAVVAHQSDLGDRRLVAYLTGDADSPAGSALYEGLIGEHLKHYQDIYDGVYGQQGKYSGEQRGLNLRIWVSSYTGQPFAKPEILQGIEDIEKRILSLRPQRLLEIGCGSGLLYFRVAPHCRRYVGTDISRAGLRHLEQQLADHAGELPESRFLHRAAHDLRGIEQERFDTVVINDVAIYFPSLDYLVRVLDQALGVLQPGGAVYLGGLRSLPLQEAFHLSVALHQAPDEMPLSQVRRRTRQRVAADKELVIDPAFFLSLNRSLPRIGQARVELKRGSSRNEVTCFQYDVFLHAASGQQGPLRQPRWLDWEAEGLSLQALPGLLSGGEPEAIGLAGIPNARLCSALAAVDYVEQAPQQATAGQAKAYLERVSGDGAVDPEDLWALAEQLPYEVSIGWQSSGPDGRYHAVFRRRPTDQPAFWDVDFLSCPGQKRQAAGGRRQANHPLCKALEGRQADQLRRHLEQSLPGCPLPEAFVAMDALPHRPDGRVDEAALPTPEDLGLGGTGESKMQSRALESRIAAICRGFLHTDRIGRQDSFFDQGGHSLLATRVLNKLRQSFGVELSLRSFFERPTVAELARQVAAAWAQGRGGARAPIPRIPRETDRHPLSFSQERLWFLHQLEPQSPAYNMHDAIRLKGALAVGALEQSLNEVVRRHETLRTTFGLQDGRPVQIIHPRKETLLPLVDLRALAESQRQDCARGLTSQEFAAAFDLAQGPLLRVRLLWLAEAEFVLLINTHHIISDGWSVGVLVRELTRLYDAFSAGLPSPLPDLPIQYADFAHWQRQRLEQGELEEQLGYWRRQLAGAPTLRLPADRPRPALRTFRGKRQLVALSPSLSRALKSLAEEQQATLFMALLAAFLTLLCRLCGQTDIVIGIDAANRNRAELEGLIGMIANQLVIRADLSGNPAFVEILKRVHKIALDAYSHQDLPFQELAASLRPKRSRDPGRNPFFQVMFSLNEFAGQAEQVSGLEELRSIAPGTSTATFDLTLRMIDTPQGLGGAMEYSTDLFDDSTIVRMAEQFKTLLASIARQPEASLNSLQLISEAEKRQQMIEEQKRKELNLQRFKKIQPKSIKMSKESVVRLKSLAPGQTLPLVIEPAFDDLDLTEWATSNLDFLEKRLLKHGGILFRGFDIDSVAKFERFATSICPDLFNENGEHPRESVSGQVYTPVFFPPEEQLLWHNENSFNFRWPLKIFFCCLKPADQGGETPIVDSRKVFESLESDLRDQFLKKQVTYMRSYGEGLGLDWRTVFNTDDKGKVEEQCRRNFVEYQWKGEDHLQTFSRRPAVTRHPKTKEMSWFNQAQHWHPACLNKATRESLESLFKEESMPRNCFFGDGSKIDDSAMEKILEKYRQLEVSFPWRRGDVLMLDNMLAAHGRNPFAGKRKILVAMGEMMSYRDLEDSETEARED